MEPSGWTSTENDWISGLQTQMSKGSFLLDTVLMQVRQQVVSLEHRTQWMAMVLEAVVALEALVEVVVPVGLVVMVLLEVQLETAVRKRQVPEVLVEARTTVEALGLVLPQNLLRSRVAVVQ